MRDDENRVTRRGRYMSPMEVVLRSIAPEFDVLNAEREWAPEVDITEDADTITVRTEIPGMAREDIEIDVANGILSIKGEKKEEKEEKNKTWHRREVRYGSFSRSFTLPTDVKSDEARASYENGVLKIVLPKEEKALHRKIEIEG
ncbi:MAG: Hsp20/alpha crystallin family protein [Candidatus Fermentibacteraceae bacterium]|nr:Hsp20/alpha crystallin family protein [Candidatus Fermentibacteraceae bacterium]MBN2607804.1 Hsp20/alpha crystallin family protein [Candidatus Fermentibacteraceae bacterium]